MCFASMPPSHFNKLCHPQKGRQALPWRTAVTCLNVCWINSWRPLCQWTYLKKCVTVLGLKLLGVNIRSKWKMVERCCLLLPSCTITCAPATGQSIKSRHRETIKRVKRGSGEWKTAPSQGQVYNCQPTRWFRCCGQGACPIVAQQWVRVGW